VDREKSFVVECFWPGVREADLEALDRRVRDVTAELARLAPIRYLGSILMREDEVVFCQFEGKAENVREVAERARIPFERIVEIVKGGTQ
jgi:Nickel responsive protein SCO4226-like